MPERPGPPGLEAEADGLIAGQYSDRPWLRPVLDAVLAALPALGPVTVQARKTFVSLDHGEGTARRDQADDCLAGLHRDRAERGQRRQHRVEHGPKPRAVGVLAGDQPGRLGLRIGRAGRLRHEAPAHRAGP